MSKKLRKEIKYIISNVDFMLLRPFIEAYISSDQNAENGSYTIRTLYYDNIDSDDLNDNLIGNEIKKKIRLRHYEGTDKFVLEVKHKIGENGYKDQFSLTKEEAKEIVSANYKCLKAKGDAGFRLYYKMTSEVYRPRSIVVYDRDPYVFTADNTRITYDYNIKATKIVSAFFDPEIYSLTPILEYQLGVLEVKYNDRVIGPLQEVVSRIAKNAVANSKYTLARMTEY